MRTPTRLDERGLLACCASPAWAAAVAAGGPYPNLAAVLTAADAELARLDWPELELALAAHPRIGEQATGTGREAEWSRREQSSATDDPAALAAANAGYEHRFGRVFLICANGRSTAEILANLRARLGNDEATERAAIRAELRGIVRLRLERWLS
jgi:2-oxo-4-hydroxy-4-carboxy-5-ureidoimidazoline decarboxylase